VILRGLLTVIAGQPPRSILGGGAGGEGGGMIATVFIAALAGSLGATLLARRWAGLPLLGLGGIMAMRTLQRRSTGTQPEEKISMCLAHWPAYLMPGALCRRQPAGLAAPG
jgi:hypothetical protein